MRFLDFKSHEGIQIFDLLASGLRRLLKQEFSENELIAHLLGRLMVQQQRNRSPITFVTYGEGGKLDTEVSKLVKIMIRSCRPMMKKS